MNYYNRYPGDYSRDTAHLSLIEHGAYAVLLDTYYATEKPLPADKKALYRICRASTAAERKAVDSVVSQFFKECDGVIRNPRADEEIANGQARIIAARENGNRGGRPRNQTTTQDKPSGLSEETQEEPTGKALQHQEGFTTGTDVPVASEKIGSEFKNKPLIPGSLCLTEGTTRARVAKPEPVTAGTWLAYSEAYRTRYGVYPVRNARVNGQLAQFVQRLGAEEAPLVAAFYLRHNRALYVSAKHATNLLLRDAEGLRTELFSGRMVTDTAARQVDKKQNNLSVAEQLIAEGKHGQ